MNRIRSTCFVGMLTLVLACSGGGDTVTGGNTGGGGSGIVAGFAPSNSNPGADSVAMLRGTASGDVVNVVVHVSDTNGIYGAAFDVTYDASRATFVGWSPGQLLEQGGHTPNYVVDNPQAGRIVIGASRSGSVPEVNAVGDVPLLTLTFRVSELGANAVAFAGPPALTDAQIPAQPLSGLSWFSGSLLGS